MVSKVFFFNYALCEKMCKNIVESDRPQMIIRRMRLTCWITTATNTHSEYVILVAFPMQSGYMNAPSCYVIRTLPDLLRNMTHTWKNML